MVTLVSPDWVQERLDSNTHLLLDPRGRMKYLRGHLRGAVNLPATRLLDEGGRLRSPQQLADLLSAVGLGPHRTPVLYDSFDGQFGALMAWTLEYLGRQDVHLMDTFFEGWVAGRRDQFYRPVAPVPSSFIPDVDASVRATLDQVKSASAGALLDVRTADEFAGRSEADQRPGHIPGASHLMWRDFLGEDHHYLASPDAIQDRLRAVGIPGGGPVVSYCRVGMRAALGYLALRHAGYPARFYDGSYAEWSNAGLPVETGP